MRRPFGIGGRHHPGDFRAARALPGLRGLSHEQDEQPGGALRSIGERVGTGASGGTEAGEEVEQQPGRVRFGVRAEDVEQVAGRTAPLVSLFAALDVHSGEVLAEPIPGKNDSANFCEFLGQIERSIDPSLEIYVVLDNGSSHTSKYTKAWFAAHPRWLAHHTPPHASWVNQVELFFSILQRKVIRNGSFTSRDDLIAKMLTFVADYDEMPSAAVPPSNGPASTSVLIPTVPCVSWALFLRSAS